MVSDLKTLAYKGCKIAVQKKFVLANLALGSGFFGYRCYQPHRSRDALSPVFIICFAILRIFSYWSEFPLHTIIESWRTDDIVPTKGSK